MLRLYKTNSKAFVFLFGFIGLIFLFSLIFSSSVSAEDVVDIINITVPVSCTISGTGMNTHNAEITNGTYQANIGTTTLHAFCNDSNGFAIYATGYTGDEIGATNSNKLVGTAASSNATIDTGLATSAGNPDVSNWAMKLAITQDSGDTSGSNAFTIDNSFNNYHIVPNEYIKVAHKNSATDMTAVTGGVKLTTTYAAYIAKTQPADTYTGKVIYTLVHPASEVPAQPQPTTAGYINYYANSTTAVGTMGRQAAADGNTVTLFASNFSRTGYGFAGWSDAYDYATNPNANFYGPNEDITVPTGTTANGLALYAVWVPSAGIFQNSAKVAELCGTGAGSLTAAVYNNEGDSDESTWSITAGLSSISALTDTRDNQTYAIAKLSDGKCWMIENLRLDNTAELTIANTNNPLNDGTNVTLKHNYTETTTYNTLSATSSSIFNADTAPDGWCTINNNNWCSDQSRLRTDNTSNRVTYVSTDTMSISANLYSYGNYYNWYSATAGRGTYSIGANATTIGDLCPFGWHLPTGHSISAVSSGGFGLLSNSLGGYKNSSNVAQTMNSSTAPTATIMDERLRHFPNNFVNSGYIYGSSLSYRGSGGIYWSSTASSNNGVYHFYFDGVYVYPGSNNGNGKYSGRVIRCLVSSGS